MSGPTIPMNPTDLPKFRSLLRRMSAEDLLSVMPDVRQRERDVESDLVIREAEQAINSCPHCGCETLVKNGHKDGRQRFQCKACNKRFNAMTGTPLARLRMADKHIPNANCMIDGLSIRDVAYKIGVNPKTAFRWRHRFLVAMEAEQPQVLSGVVEADETFFLESFKGKRSNMPRPAKKRGTPAKSPGLSKEQIPVIVARDRSTGATLTEKDRNTQCEKYRREADTRSIQGHASVLGWSEGLCGDRQADRDHGQEHQGLEEGQPISPQ
jgi:transposase-like protein